MSETITSAYRVEKNKLRNMYPHVWLVQAQIDATYVVRIAGHSTSVSWNSLTWAAYPIEVGVDERQLDGQIPLRTMTVANIGGEVGAYVRAGGFVDREVRIYAVNLNALGSTDALDFGTWTVNKAVLGLEAATFELGPYALNDAPFPARRSIRSRCDKLYGDTDCGYNTAMANQIAGTYPSFDTASCDYTLDGANGCRVHGHNEVANGKPRLHPRRYGGEPGIAKGRARD